jgi:serine/threonine protein kinase
MMLTVGDRTWVKNKSGRIGAELVADMPRHFIFRLDDGRFAKIVKWSSLRRGLDEMGEKLRRQIVRNRLAWRFLTRQNHPGLLRVYERVVDEQGDEGYTCEALTPDLIVSGGELHPLAESLRVFLESGATLGDALGAVHDAGRVHVDVTPYNILRRGMTPVLIDFEMAVCVGQFASDLPSLQDYDYVVLTPSCCSPGQVNRLPVTPALDIYCLALTMLSWVSGRYGVARDTTRSNPRRSMSICASGRYPHWDLVTPCIDAPDVIGLFTRMLEVSPSRRPANGNVFAALCRGLLRSLPSHVLDRAMVAREPLHPSLEMLDETESIDQISISS